VRGARVQRRLVGHGEGEVVEAAAINDATFLLLSLIDPHWPNRSYATSDRTWKWIGYADLADAIEHRPDPRPHRV
jgi:hypothetical protein